MAIVIRPVEIRDVPTLWEVEHRVLLAGDGQVRLASEGSEDRVADRVQAFVDGRWSGDRGAMFVAEVGGVPVGEAQVHKLDPTYCNHVASLGIHLDPSAQGRGLGRALMERLLAWSRDHGVRRLELCVRADNHRAIRLYRGLGFAEELRRVGFLSLPHCTVDIAMVLHLVPTPTHKAVAVGLREQELLFFEHPHAGWQLPKGGVEPGERPEEAVLRELAEETGVDRVERSTPLGWWTVANGTSLQTWHGFLLDLPRDLPDRWTHVATGSPEEEGLALVCRFTPFDEQARAIFPPLFHEALVRALEARGRWPSAI
ncbi:MAG: GNAT family N-acetyltransferase [Alphaproteobacteria bacterium]|nr:GNAT family N-acetyltransferase [Alphaproteobacteria bacterium]MCB9695239.1 GNAT family N-acetyltransferase [Alphaproteobacteria bacterium]